MVLQAELQEHGTRVQKRAELRAPRPKTERRPQVPLSWIDVAADAAAAERSRVGAELARSFGARLDRRGASEPGRVSTRDAAGEPRSLRGGDERLRGGHGRLRVGVAAAVSRAERLRNLSSGADRASQGRRGERLRADVRRGPGLVRRRDVRAPRAPPRPEAADGGPLLPDARRARSRGAHGHARRTSHAGRRLGFTDPVLPGQKKPRGNQSESGTPKNARRNVAEIVQEHAPASRCCAQHLSTFGYRAQARSRRPSRSGPTRTGTRPRRNSRPR